ncbi:hypothetical protein C9374_002871 [Naegleria lovaniensis]|uniref:Uncharacterized protein n=1 Tax=Naegleria lovaniensis TaxID=51637 RepID=A0AA88KK64_NAELO|nr:uncharacterized protein C9374_002871 [Naegleria lovaniensis]KAG2386425.1 hypothetical protein C9374_002871 [Naegleria lovaniensis]
MPGAFTSKKRLAYMGSASSSSSSSLHPLNGGVADPSSVFHQSQQQQVSSDSLLAHEGFSSEIKLQPKKNDWTSSTKTIHESFHHSISNSSSRSTRPSLKASSSLPSSIHVNHSYPFHPLKMYQHHPEVFGTSSLNEPQHIQLEFMKPHSLVFSSTSSLSSSTMNHSNTTHKSSSSNGEDHSHETDDTATKAKNKISRYASLPDHIYVKPMSYNNSTTTTTSPHYLAPPPPTKDALQSFASYES